MVKLILVTHGTLAQHMLETAGQILGKQADGVETLSVTTSSSIEQGANTLKNMLKIKIYFIYFESMFKI